MVDQIEPGPRLAVFLSSLEGKHLSGHDRIAALKAKQRMVSFFQAQVYEEMTSISDLIAETEPDPALAAESAAAEIEAALRLTRRTAESELDMALSLKQRLPRAWAALAAGKIDWRRARVIVTGTSHLSDATAKAVVEQVIEPAARLTTGQLNALLRRRCIQADPDQAANRYREALGDRRITIEPTVDGTTNVFGLNLAPDRVSAVMRRITDLAQRLKTRHETRTLDQIRADVFLDLLEGNRVTFGKGQRGRGTVDIHVDLETLTRLSEGPGELAGYGPVIADIARQVTEQQRTGQWRWSVTDPKSGQVIHNGITRRRPDAQTSRHVQARNQHCIFPGCRMPALDCDLDHRIPWAQGGPTTTDQLVPLCRHHHRIRHRHAWEHQQLPNGDHKWVSPLGHTYTTSAKHIETQPP